MIMTDLAYQTLERISVVRPVERVKFIADRCRNKRVLDIGCLDETALDKRDTGEWLHRRIALVARRVIGIDSSDTLPPEGLETGPRSRIMKGDGTDPRVVREDVDIIVAGEFIEHIPNPLAFLNTMRTRYPGCEMLLSTPNGVSVANGLLGTICREAQHRDHLMTSTYKTLNTLCRRSGCSDWEIIPYRFYATEMLLQTSGAKRMAVRMVEIAIRHYERLFPLRSFGYVVRMTL